MNSASNSEFNNNFHIPDIEFAMRVAKEKQKIDRNRLHKDTRFFAIKQIFEKSYFNQVFRWMSKMDNTVVPNEQLHQAQI